MQDNVPGLDGPDFLHKVADAELAQGNDINADTFRQRAREWRQLQADHDSLQQRNGQLQRSLDAARAAVREVA